MFDLLDSKGLLIRKRKCRIPRTTYSDHWMRKYSNLIREFILTAVTVAQHLFSKNNCLYSSE